MIGPDRENPKEKGNLMTIRDRKQLKQTAHRRLEAASYKPNRLVLIHCGVSLGAALLLKVLNYMISWQIERNGGGLGGMQLRAVLETADAFLQMVYMVLMPFWTIGLTYAALRLVRGKAAWPQCLLEGFSRKGPVLRLLLMQGLVYSIITVAAMVSSYSLYGMTPDGQAFNMAMMRLWAEYGFNNYVELYEAIPEPVLEQVTRGYMPIFAVAAAVLMIPAAYRLRFAPYALMDKDDTGAWKAIRTSGKITRRNGWRLVALDLSFWWYYLVKIVLMLPAFASVLLPLLNVELPVDEAVLYLGGNLIYALLTLIFESKTKPKVMTTYALAYDTLLEQYQLENPPAPEEAGQVVDSSGYTVRNEE